jgi:hypothetical protein
MSEPNAPQPPEELTQEEFARALAERLGHTPVRDVVFQSLMTFLDMAAIRLGLGPAGPEVADVAQARQAIEASRALIAVAEREMGAAQVRPFKEPLAQLQMAYARVMEAMGEEAPAEGAADRSAAGEGAAASPQPPPAAPGGDPASRLWVPPGTVR